MTIKSQTPNPLTVQQVIEFLQRQDPDAQVWSRICGWTGRISEIYLAADGRVVIDDGVGV